MYAELQENPFEEEEDDIALSLTGEYNQYVAPLRDWLLQVVKDNQVLVCSEESIMQNQLLSEVSLAIVFTCDWHCRANIACLLKNIILWYLV